MWAQGVLRCLEVWVSLRVSLWKNFTETQKLVCWSVTVVDVFFLLNWWYRIQVKFMKEHLSFSWIQLLNVWTKNIKRSRNTNKAGYVFAIVQSSWYLNKVIYNGVGYCDFYELFWGRGCCVAACEVVCLWFSVLPGLSVLFLPSTTMKSSDFFTDPALATVLSLYHQGVLLLGLAFSRSRGREYLRGKRRKLSLVDRVRNLCKSSFLVVEWVPDLLKSNAELQRLSGNLSGNL